MEVHLRWARVPTRPAMAGAGRGPCGQVTRRVMALGSCCDRSLRCLHPQDTGGTASSPEAAQPKQKGQRSHWLEAMPEAEPNQTQALGAGCAPGERESRETRLLPMGSPLLAAARAALHPTSCGLGDGAQVQRRWQTCDDQDAACWAGDRAAEGVSPTGNAHRERTSSPSSSRGYSGRIWGGGSLLSFCR